jgi:hypothetical protein
MIRIRHSSKPFDELELEGSNSELSELRAAIHRFCEGSEPAADYVADSAFDPSPDHHGLASIHFDKTTEPLLLRGAGCTLSVSGKPEFLRLFAENLPYDAQHTSSIPYHVHFDRAGRDDMVSAASLGIVLVLRK